MADGRYTEEDHVAYRRRVEDEIAAAAEVAHQDYPEWWRAA